MVIDFGVITNVSGLLKAITYTIRVMISFNFKAVKPTRICPDD
jgi:hypothetical protein